MGFSTREISATFCAGHRVLGQHPCNTIHGHSFTVRLRFAPLDLFGGVNGVGEIPGTEFSQSLQAYCTQYLDRAFFASDEDTSLPFGGDAAKIVRATHNPTLEGLCLYFAEVVIPFLPMMNQAQMISVSVSDESATATWVREAED